MGDRKSYYLCTLCRINHNYKGHKYTPKHTQLLQQKLKKEQKRIDEIKFFLKNKVVAVPESTNEKEYTFFQTGAEEERKDSFWCYFCQYEIKNLGCTHVHYDTLRHLSSSEHHKKVQKFFTENVPEKKIREQIEQSNSKTKKKNPASEEQEEWMKASSYLISKSQFKQYSSKDTSDDEEEVKVVLQPEPLKASVPSNTTTSVTTETTTSSPLTPQVHQTLISPLGILQNPTGWHEGKRVWGGGIIKVVILPFSLFDVFLFSCVFLLCHFPPSLHLFKQIHKTMNSLTITQVKKTSWIPWELDNLEDEALTYTHDFMGTEGIVKFSAIATARKNALTAKAGNIHTGATPPWMSKDDEEEGKVKGDEGKKKLSGGDSDDEDLSYLLPKNTATNKAWKSKGRIGADVTIDRSVKDDDNWLPNFGGVWQAGPRKESLREMRRQLNKEKKDGGKGHF
eukprot:TRINITY_DN2333_c0_g1_i1.p1 TRINITY_DN2333_c0_g1~~TRINITY_DN2333_c0_g1_i1.p1  ORF type:complete len:452 (+),score=120.71 TRINITY_DN2333_c0_g1_i1:43-1398(+)